MSQQNHIPLASIRVSLRWPPAPAFEDTDTLVISGRTGFFLDLRFFLDGDRKGQIDWASAGWKRWLSDSTPEAPKASFEALIDSRRAGTSPAAPDAPPDEGTFSTLANGDTLETGSMSNPDAEGAVQAYEEIWRRLGIPKDARVVILASEDGQSFLGRVDKFQLGLRDAAQDGTTPFMARRWELDAAGQWLEVYSSGSDLESALPLVPQIVQGDTVQVGAHTWKVIENS